MKSSLLFLAILCALPGCTTPTTPRPQPVHRGEAPPFVFISGEFWSPGRYVWTNGMSLKEGIAAAGGFTDFARRKFRLQHWDGSVETYWLGTGRALTNNPPLRAGDF